MRLQALICEKGSKNVRKRVGRGAGSGMGKTSGRGHKGGKARSGYTPSPVASGIPYYRRLPKRGFNNQRFVDEMGYVNLRDLGGCEGAVTIDRELLVSKGILSAKIRQFKVLGNGTCLSAIKIVADRFSAAAKAKILASGGEVVELMALKER